MDKINGNDDLMMADSENPRENLISTAVNFLQNPKVRGSPIEQKKLFLEKKGLTKAEVDIAVGRSGVLENGQTQPFQTGSQLIPIAAGSVTSRWSQVRDFTALVIVVGGVGTVLYRFYHSIIKPYWFGGVQKSVELQILEMQQKMVDSLMKVQESLEAIQQSLQAQEEKVNQIAVESVSRNVQAANLSQQSYSNAELKSEINSIKALLLNRRQFPPTPNTSPVLPAWQRTKTSSPPTVQEKQEDTTTDQVLESSSKTSSEIVQTGETCCGSSDPTEIQEKETTLPDLSLSEANRVNENKDVEKDATDTENINRASTQNGLQSNGVLATDDTTLEIAH